MLQQLINFIPRKKKATPPTEPPTQNPTDPAITSQAQPKLDPTGVTELALPQPTTTLPDSTGTPQLNATSPASTQHGETGPTNPAEASHAAARLDATGEPKHDVASAGSATSNSPQHQAVTNINVPKVGDPVKSIFQQSRWKAGIFDLPTESNVRWFNPSVASWGGATWLAVRRAFGQPLPLGQNSIEVFNIDHRTKQVSNRQPVRFIHSYAQEHYEDPRLVVLSNQLFVSCTNFKINRYAAHQVLARLTDSGPHPECAHIVYGLNGESLEANTGNEKNWVWFQTGSDWHFVYQPWPHHVVRTAFGSPQESYVAPEMPCPWQYGLPRGGTPPVLVGGLRWSFFHSSINGDESKGEPRRRYYMGAYAFDYLAPFRIRAMTLKPLLIGSEEDGGVLPVVFPGGAIYNDGVWLVAYGVNDLFPAWVEIPHPELISLMTEI